MPEKPEEKPAIDILLDAVRAAMNERNVGQAELSRQTGLHQKMIWKWLNREVFPNGPATLTLLCWVTGVKLDTILSLR